jgi:hypothetical protein
VLPRPAVTLLAVVLGLSAAARSYGGAPSAPRNVADTAWSGKETLQGFGPLLFDFQPDGTAVMCDASCVEGDRRTYIRGKWTQSGDRVEIRFRNCVYTGRIRGQELSGRAQYLDGTHPSWEFRLRVFREPIPPPPPPGEEGKSGGSAPGLPPTA